MRLKDVTEFCPAYTGAARNDDVAFVPMEALRYDSIAQQEIPFEEARGKYTFFADGDLLFAKVTPCFENGNIAVATNLKGGIGFGSSEIFVLRAKPGLNNRYLFYVVQASPFMDGGCATMCGVGGLKRMSPLFPRTFEWEIPSEESQRKLVAYLDEKSAAIDARVAVLEKKLAAYKRLKTSIINRAVTRGLDPKAKLKDSGVEWIGKVPEGWEVMHLKRLAVIRTGNSPAKFEGSPYYSDEEGIPWIKADDLGTGCAISETAEYITKEGAALARIMKPRSTYVCCIASVGKCGFSEITCCCNQQINALEYGKSMDWRYGYYATLNASPLYKAFANVNVLPILNTSRQGQIPYPCPPLSEQRAIADYLDAECAKIDKMAELVMREIELYKKLKRSLINEVMTGKRPVFADKPLRRGKEVSKCGIL